MPYFQVAGRPPCPSARLCTLTSGQGERRWASEGGPQRCKHSLELADPLRWHRSRHRQLTFERLIEHGPRRLEERLKPGR